MGMNWLRKIAFRMRGSNQNDFNWPTKQGDSCLPHICPVCHYDALFEPPYDADGMGSYEVCPCCGFEFGCDDYPDRGVSIRNWRREWVASGCNWFSSFREPPAGWAPDTDFWNIQVALELGTENYCTNFGNVYISLGQIIQLPELIRKTAVLPDLLVTPYLIDPHFPVVYDLLGYECYIEYGDFTFSHLVDNLAERSNCTPRRVKACIVRGDVAFSEQVLRTYLENIQTFPFAKERSSDFRLKKAELYFQVF